MSEDLFELVKAIRANDLQQLSRLLATVSDIGVRSPAGRTALHFAAEEANLDAVRLLLNAGLPVDARTNKGETPLHLAVRYGHGRGWILEDPDFDPDNPWERIRRAPAHPQVAQAVFEILSRYDPDLSANLNMSGRSPAELKWEELVPAVWLIAGRRWEDFRSQLRATGMNIDSLDPAFARFAHSLSCYPATVALLLDRGADSNALDDAEDSALCEAVLQGEPKMLKLLLERGADPNLGGRSEDRPGQTPMELALDGYTANTARLLLQYGGKLDFEKDYPLHAAAGRGATDLVLWLLEVGGEINQRDLHGDTPLMQAACGHDETVRVLCERGANLLCRNDAGESPLHLAAPWPRCLELLLSRSLPLLNARDNRGLTPLHFAARAVAEESIVLLAAAGADINTQDTDGNTPLHIILFGEELRPDIEYPAFQALVAAGADRSLRNNKGKTPLDLVTEFRYPKRYLELLNPGGTPPATLKGV